MKKRRKNFWHDWHDEQERFWHGTLENVAKHYGIEGQVLSTKTLVDGHRQWSAALNVPANAAVRTAAVAAVSLASKLFKGSNKT